MLQQRLRRRERPHREPRPGLRRPADPARAQGRRARDGDVQQLRLRRHQRLPGDGEGLSALRHPADACSGRRTRELSRPAISQARSDTLTTLTSGEVHSTPLATIRRTQGDARGRRLSDAQGRPDEGQEGRGHGGGQPPTPSPGASPRQLAAQGAEMAFTYLAGHGAPRASRWPRASGVKLLIPADVTDDASMDAAFAERGEGLRDHRLLRPLHRLRQQGRAEGLASSRTPPATASCWP